MCPNSPERWYQTLGRRVLVLGWLKGIGTPAFMAAFFAIYLPLLHRPAFEPTVIPAMALDAWIAPQDWAVSLYISLWFYVSLPPGLTRNFRELLGYGAAAAALSAAGFTCFYFWPTVLPSTGYDWAGMPALAWLKGMDQSGNSCPSMHVAFAVFSGVWLHRLLDNLKAPRVWLAVNAAWCAGIVYSTLATKQHLVIDVAAGALLGSLAAFVYGRLVRPRRLGREPSMLVAAMGPVGAASTTATRR